MSNEIEFVNGLTVKAPNERAPDYVKAKLSMRREALIAWLQQQDGEWINADVKVSQNGKWYCAVDTWSPDQKKKSDRQAPKPPVGNEGFEDSEIPF